MHIPKSLVSVITSFEKLPGVGPKTAQRLGYYLLRVPQGYLDDFADSLTSLKKSTKFCEICKNIDEISPCTICSDKARDVNTILVVEDPLDALAFERGGKFHGVYHVLHGKISPLENIGPDEIFMSELFKRVTPDTKELIIATNPTMEGEATAMYIARHFKDTESPPQITRLGIGIPTGADLEYADEVTLNEAIAGRRKM